MGVDMGCPSAGPREDQGPWSRTEAGSRRGWKTPAHRCCVRRDWARSTTRGKGYETCLTPSPGAKSRSPCASTRPLVRGSRSCECVSLSQNRMVYSVALITLHPRPGQANSACPPRPPLSPSRPARPPGSREVSSVGVLSLTRHLTHRLVLPNPASCPKERWAS